MERLTNRIIIPKEERDIVVFTQGEYIDTIPAEKTDSEETNQNDTKRQDV